MIYIPLPIIHYPLPNTQYPHGGASASASSMHLNIYRACACAREKRFFCDHLSAMTGDFSFFDGFFILQKKMSIFATDEKKMKIFYIFFQKNLTFLRVKIYL